MLYDFTEPVCRACCNYEGIDRIAEVIEKARQLRKNFDGQPSDSNCRVKSPHDLPTSLVAPNRPIVTHSPTTGYAVIPGRNGTKQVIAVTTAGPQQHPSFHFPGLMTQSNIGPIGPVVVPTTAPHSRVPMPVFPISKPVHPTVVDPVHQPETTQRFAQIQETLNTLSKSPPFRVRFSKDHTLVGRVIAFDAVCRGSDYELKVFVEYPIGSGTVFQSASGAGRQMYGEFRERLGIGGGFRGASSNGYKDLEFERNFGVDEWRMLGELLTEEVRFFRGAVRKELLPVPYVDANYPNIPPANMSNTRGFLKNNLLNRKRRSSNEDESENKKGRPVSITNGVDSVGSPKSVHSPISPHSEQAVSPMTNGDGGSSPKTPERKSPSEVTVVMECLLCHKALDDTRFVQCPSTVLHKFCFACSRESIKTQSVESQDVYCPSSMKCLVKGSTTPWAFMEAEITTILKSDC